MNCSYCWHRAASAFVVALVLSCLAGPAQAQSGIVARVNGQPITSYDVDQRVRVARMMNIPMDSKSALQDLIDDKVKLTEARRNGYSIPDSYVDSQIERLAKSNGKNMVEFNQYLGQAGVDMSAYREKMRAGYAWEVINERRNKGTESSDPLFRNAGKGGNVTDYKLYSVIFVVPNGTSPAAAMASANQARAKFTNCQTGFDMLRQLPNAAVRPPVVRSSEDLSPEMNKILAATPLNRLAPPFPTGQGIETVAVCEKTTRYSRTAGTPDGKSEKEKAADSINYLKSLRAKSVIQMR